MPMNWRDAAHKTVHSAGGSKVIAERMGGYAGVIRAKANPDDNSRWFDMQEMVELMSLTNDHRMLEALADEFGYMLTSVPEEIDSADRGLMQMISDSLKGHDGEVEKRRGLAQLKGHAGAAIRRKINKLQAFLADLAQLTDD